MRRGFIFVGTKGSPWLSVAAIVSLVAGLFVVVLVLVIALLVIALVVLTVILRTVL